jgi:hypothetical protein
LKILVSGRYAFLADWSEGLLVIDCNDPSHPIKVAGFNNGAWEIDQFYKLIRSPKSQTNDLVIDGDMLYLADGSDGVEILNISNPLQPKLIGNYTQFNQSLEEVVALDVINSVVYAAAMNDGLYLLNVTDPATPQWVGNYSLIFDTYFNYTRVPQVSDVAVNGNQVYIYDSSNLIRLNTTNPQNIVNSSNPIMVGCREDITLTSNYCWISDGSNGVYVYQLDANNSFQLKGQYHPRKICINNIVVDGKIAFCANAYDGLLILDFTASLIWSSDSGNYSTIPSLNGIPSSIFLIIFGSTIIILEMEISKKKLSF